MTHSKEPTCVLDQDVINKDTLGDLHDMGLSFFATLCGRNRGAFVLNPTDHHTWGCTALPPQFAQLAGVPLADANAIKTQFQGGNLTASETIELLDVFVKSVYFSTPNKATDPFACELGGLARLQCDPVNTLPTIRSVTLAGLFTEALWATGGAPLTLKQARHFYTAKDFREMRDYGLNTVQIPVPVMAFDDDDDDKQLLEVLSDILELAEDAHLQAILVLEGADNDDAVAAAAHFCADRNNVFALTLPSEQSLRAARAAEELLKLFVPINLNTIKDMNFPDANVFGALNMEHTSTVADIASSTSVDDRMKLFYHEALACIGRSPLEYATCFQRVPVFVSGGFDLSVDNCAMQNSPSFVDYGQCDRLEETIHSDWWHRHRKSFFARQLFSYEHGLGWSFAAWKLYSEDDGNVGVLDSWAKLLSFKDVAAADLVTSLITDQDQRACLNPPVADFTLGDATLAPTPGPPPDCGNGWWNASINDCSYWIPPAPTPVPTRAPFTASPTVPCPECAICSGDDMSMLYAGAAGFLVGVVAMALWNCIASRRRGGYTEIPTMNV